MESSTDMFNPVLYREEIQSLEYLTYSTGVSPQQLMENAGTAFVNEITPELNPKSRITIIVSKGNNGGDGLVAYTKLKANYDITLVFLGKPEMKSNEAKYFFSSLIKNTTSTDKLYTLGSLESVDKFKPIELSEFEEIIRNSDIVIDAIFGINLKSEIRKPLFNYFKLLKSVLTEESSIKLFCLDVPSGLDVNTGIWHGPEISPDLIVTFQFMKRGLVKFQDQTKVVKIGVLDETLHLSSKYLFYSSWYHRGLESHKGNNGRILIIGGSEEFTGAPVLSSRSALRAGVDTARIVIPQSIRQIVSSFSEDFLVFQVRGNHHGPKNKKLLRDLAIRRHDVVAVGMGLSNNEDGYKFVRAFVPEVSKKMKVLLDADAVRAFRDNLKLLKDTGAVITPHKSELRYLLNEPIPDDFEELKTFLLNKAKELGIIIVLKGRVDLITDGTQIYENHTGHPGMTVGGTGDVLAGLIAACMAFIKERLLAAVIGTYIMGLAGEKAAEIYGNGLLATDVVERIAVIILSLEKQRDGFIGELNSGHFNQHSSTS